MAVYQAGITPTSRARQGARLSLTDTSGMLYTNREIRDIGGFIMRSW